MAREIQANPPETHAVDYSPAAAEFAIGLSPIQEPVWPTTGGAGEPRVAANTDANYNRLLDTIQARVPGITLDMIELEMWNASDEFCLRSTYFRHRAWWRMAPGVNTVALDPFSQHMEVAWVIQQHGLWRYQVDPPATLVDLEIPTTHRTGHVLMVLKPKSMQAVKEGSIPHLFRNFFEVILDGVLFRLFNLPAKPWSNGQLTQYHGLRWWAGVNRARDIANRANGPDQSDFRRYPYWARGRRKQ
jgi:hypothetical protein